MTVFTDADARGKLDDVLAEARTSGEVRIRLSNGEEFILRPAKGGRSPLDVGSITLDPPITADEIVAAVRAGRERPLP